MEPPRHSESTSRSVHRRGFVARATALNNSATSTAIATSSITAASSTLSTTSAGGAGGASTSSSAGGGNAGCVLVDDQTALTIGTAGVADEYALELPASSISTTRWS